MEKTKKLVIAALFAALCCIATMIHIPSGPTLGYVHLGDALVLFSGIILGPVYGSLAAGIGSMMADVINGYPLYVPGTFVIKALCALVCGLLFHSLKKKAQSKGALYPVLILSSVVAELVMVLGYFLYEIGLFMITGSENPNFATAIATSLTGIPYNLAQGLVAVVLCVVLVPILTKINDLRDAILG